MNRFIGIVLLLLPAIAQAGYFLPPQTRVNIQSLVDSGSLAHTLPKDFTIKDIRIQKDRILLDFRPDCILTLSRNPQVQPPWFKSDLKCRDSGLAQDTGKKLLSLGLLVNSAFHRSPWKLIVKTVYKPKVQQQQGSQWSFGFAPPWFTILDAAAALIILIVGLIAGLWGLFGIRHDRPE